MASKLIYAVLLVSLAVFQQTPGLTAEATGMKTAASKSDNIFNARREFNNEKVQQNGKDVLQNRNLPLNFLEIQNWNPTFPVDPNYQNIDKYAFGDNNIYDEVFSELNNNPANGQLNFYQGGYENNGYSRFNPIIFNPPFSNRQNNLYLNNNQNYPNFDAFNNNNDVLNFVGPNNYEQNGLYFNGNPYNHKISNGGKFNFGYNPNGEVYNANGLFYNPGKGFGNNGVFPNTFTNDYIRQNNFYLPTRRPNNIFSSTIKNMDGGIYNGNLNFQWDPTAANRYLTFQTSNTNLGANKNIFPGNNFGTFNGNNGYKPYGFESQEIIIPGKTFQTPVWQTTGLFNIANQNIPGNSDLNVNNGKPLMVNIDGIPPSIPFLKK